jgi:hypothetical protein
LPVALGARITAPYWSAAAFQLKPLSLLLSMMSPLAVWAQPCSTSTSARLPASVGWVAGQ